LIAASANGQMDVVLYLLNEANADAFLTTSDGKTALDIAQEKGHPRLVQLLKEHMATGIYHFLKFFCHQLSSMQ
jgi:ankyrin repeat protein